MVVIRPVTIDDLDQFESLVTLAGFGLTSLPKDRQFLEKRILASQQGFEAVADKPAGESYLFVMEDLTSGRVIGTSGIVSKVGGFEPFYAYRIETSVHESKTLEIRKEIETLHLVQEHNGPCEIGSLFLAPNHRKSGNGRLLSLSRFLFMAQHREFFELQVIAEMRGVIDKKGRSPFWEALGQHFFEVEYPTADYLSIVNKKFIADLMPTHPIYIPLLPQQAQDVIGQVHENTRPALGLLESEGFSSSGMVDIFEAGPIMTCVRDEIRTIQDSQAAVVSRITDDAPASQEYMISNTTRRQFRACLGVVTPHDDASVSIPKLVARALNVKIGDTVRYAEFRPSPSRQGAQK